MTGGYGFVGEAMISVEVILEDGSTCKLPDFPPPGRYRHTANGLTVCGGGCCGLFYVVEKARKCLSRP